MRCALCPASSDSKNGLQLQRTNGLDMQTTTNNKQQTTNNNQCVGPTILDRSHLPARLVPGKFHSMLIAFRALCRRSAMVLCQLQHPQLKFCIVNLADFSRKTGSKFESQLLVEIGSRLIHWNLRASECQVPDSYSDFLRRLCRQLLDRDPKKRPSADEVPKKLHPIRSDFDAPSTVFFLNWDVMRFSPQLLGWT